MASGGKVIVKIDGDTKNFKEKFDKLKGYAGKAAKVIAVGFTAAAGAVTAIGMAAVKAYGDYEQLVGGIETLFGTGGQTLEEYAASTKRTTQQAAKDYEKLTAVQEKMLHNAHSAFERAGMSANTYMETATSFAASLVASLGGDTDKAADYADRAMVDMSDNANKMGTNLEMIQNAYQGFAKQNYTMLDNLKLGYGGTQEEMKRLIKDASKMKDVQKELGVTVDASSMSFGNIVNAISVMQKSMGIAGTTAKEATTTIQGSLNMTKAAWENLMIALANPDGNVGEAIDDLIFAAEKVGENMLPIIQNVLNKIPEMISGLGSTIVSKLPEVVNTILPQLAASAMQLLTVFADTVSENSDSMADAAVSVMGILINGIVSSAPTLIEAAENLITSFITALCENDEQIASAAVLVVETLISGIASVTPNLMTASLNIILSLCRGLTQSLPELIPVMVEAVLTMADTLLDNIDTFIDVGIDLLLALVDGLIKALPDLIDKVPVIIEKLITALLKAIPKMYKAAGQLFGGLISGAIAVAPRLVTMVVKLVHIIRDAFKTWLTQTMPSVGINLVKGLIKGITDNWHWITTKIKEWCKGILDNVKAFFGIHSPSTVMRDEIGKMIDLGIAEGIEENTKAIEDVIKEQKQTIVDTYKSMAEAAIDSIDEVAKAQETFADKLKDWGNLYTTDTYEIGGVKYSVARLADLDKQNEQLQDYAETLLQVKERGDIPAEFFTELRDLSVEDGLAFAKGLLAVSDDEFTKYIDSWKRKQESADVISKFLYADETQKANEEISKKFDDFNSDIEQKGKDNAAAWGEGFFEKIREVMPKIQSRIEESLNSIAPYSGFIPSMAGGNVSNTSNVYNITANSNETNTDTLTKWRNWEKLQKARGGY